MDAAGTKQRRPAQWLDALEEDEQQDTATGKRFILSNELHVARALAAFSSYENPDQPVWPSVATLVRKTRLSESSVKRALKNLATACYVQIVRQTSAHGDSATNRYFFQCPLPSMQNATPPAAVNPPSVQPEPPSVQCEPTPSVQCEPQTRIREQELNMKKNNNSARLPASPVQAVNVVVDSLVSLGMQQHDAQRYFREYPADILREAVKITQTAKKKSGDVQNAAGYVVKVIKSLAQSAAQSAARAASPPRPAESDRKTPAPSANAEHAAPAQIATPPLAAPDPTEAAWNALPVEQQEAIRQGVESELHPFAKRNKLIVHAECLKRLRDTPQATASTPAAPPPAAVLDPPAPTERSSAPPSRAPVPASAPRPFGFVKSARAGSLNELVSVAALLIAAEQAPPASAPAAGP